MMWKPIPNSTTNTENLILWIDTVKDALLKGASFFLLHAHARGHPEGGGDGGQHGNDDVQNFAPNVFFHFLERLRVKG